MKTAQLQIRLTPAQKASLRRRARRAGMDVSAWVLARIAPDSGRRFAGILRTLRDPAARRFALAELNDLLADLPAAEFADAVDDADPAGLPPEDANRVAAMVEHAAALKGVAPPRWTRGIPPLDRPRFASDLPGLRAHLLRASPVAFRRRNLFVDSTIGDRV